MEPERIGRYVVIGQLGKGGMGTVYQVHDPALGRDVALKILTLDSLGQKNARERFQREIRLIAKIAHPFIVKIFEVGEWQGQPFYTMELMEGGSLADKIAQGYLSINEVIRILERLIPALDKIHTEGIVHRDLKPSNILFDRGGNPYLADFGIAKFIQQDVDLTSSSGVIGTPYYMSPEQWTSNEVDARSDIFQLGIVLYEMLTGVKPFDAKTPFFLSLAALNKPLPLLSEFRPELPLSCQKVIQKATAKEPGERYTNVFELLQELRFVLEKTDPPHRQDGRAKSFGKWLIAILIGIALGIAGSIFWITIAPQIQNPISAVTNTPSFTPRYTKSIAPSQTSTETATPSQTPAPTASETVATETIVVIPTTAVPTDTHTPTFTPFPSPFPSPTLPSLGGADKLAFVKNGDIWVVNVADGSDLRQLTYNGGSKTNLVWSPDGQKILFVAGTCIESVAVGNKNLEDVVCFNWLHEVAGFDISPDHNWMAVSLRGPKESSSNGLYIIPYDLEKLGRIKYLTQWKDAIATNACATYEKDIESRAVKWANDNQRLSLIVDEKDNNGLAYQVIRLLTIDECGNPLSTITTIRPQVTFKMPDYAKSPIIESFDWDGESRYALNVDTLHGLGKMYIHTMNLATQELLPISGQCCYRDFQWSPDGRYLFFVFWDSSLGKTRMYYLPSNDFGVNTAYQSIPISESFFTDVSYKQLEQLFSPALRPISLEAISADTPVSSGSIHSPPEYTVEKYSLDSLFTIASEWKVSFDALLGINGIRCSSSLMPDTIINPVQTFSIPGIEQPSDFEVVTAPKLTHIFDTNCFNRIDGLAFSPDGKILAISTGNSAYLFEVPSWHPLVWLRGHEARVTRVLFSPDGQLVATASNDSTVKLWHTDGSLAATLNHGAVVTSIAFSPDGHELVSTSLDQQVHFWMLDGTEIPEKGKNLSGYSYLSVAYSSGNSELIAFGLDSKVKIYDLNNFQVYANFNISYPAYKLTFSQDGTMLAANADVWNIETQTHIHQFTRYPWPNHDVIFSEDGKYLYNGNNLWDVSDWHRVDTFSIPYEIPKVTSTERDWESVAVSIDVNGIWLAIGSLEALVIWRLPLAF